MLFVYQAGTLFVVVVVATGIVKAVLKHRPTTDELRDMAKDLS